MIPRTTWADKTSPYSGKVPFKEVPIPKRTAPRKGKTKYDEEFERLLEFKHALETHEDNLGAMQRALKRFIKLRELSSTVSLRQQLNPITRNVTLWLEKKK